MNFQDYAKRTIKMGLGRLGYELRPRPKKEPVPAHLDLEADALDLIEKVRPFTLTSVERIYGLIRSIDYICDAGIQGDFVECGVWRGGSMLTVALRLKQKQSAERILWLYDTFEGMPEPEALDVSRYTGIAKPLYDKLKTSGSSSWCAASLDDVQNTLKLAEYSDEKLRFVRGKVEDTIPREVPENIALLRLDTDWYSSTRHELIHLFPRLVPGGVLIIDDYGHWEGCRRAVDEYFVQHPPRPLLIRVDYTGRIGVKVA